MAKVTKNSQTSSNSRSVRLGDRVFFWMPEGGELKPRVAFLSEYSEFSNLWSVLMVSGGILIPYPGVNYSEKPAAFAWTFEDQVEPIIVKANPTSVTVKSTQSKKKNDKKPVGLARIEPAPVEEIPPAPPEEDAGDLVTSMEQ